MTQQIEKFHTRFIPEELLPELANLWHTAIVVFPADRYDRMLLTARWFSEKYPQFSRSAVYKDLDAWLNWN